MILFNVQYNPVKVSIKSTIILRSPDRPHPQTMNRSIRLSVNTFVANTFYLDIYHNKYMMCNKYRSDQECFLSRNVEK